MSAKAGADGQSAPGPAGPFVCGHRHNGFPPEPVPDLIRGGNDDGARGEGRATTQGVIPAKAGIHWGLSGGLGGRILHVGQGGARTGRPRPDWLTPLCAATATMDSRQSLSRT